MATNRLVLGHRVKVSLLLSIKTVRQNTVYSANPTCMSCAGLADESSLGTCLFIRPVRPELVEGYFISLILLALFRAWFDRLTTNGIDQGFLGVLRLTSAFLQH